MTTKLVLIMTMTILLGTVGMSANLFQQAYAEPSMQFDKESYCPTELAIITMNDVFFHQNFIDIFTGDILLNSQPTGEGFALVETDLNSGFYFGDFQITETIGGIPVSDGDIITAEIPFLSLSASAVIQCGPSSPDLTIQDLIDEVNSMSLQKGTQRSLVSNLDSAIEKLTDDNENNDSAVCGDLESFVNKVNAQDGKKLTEDQASTLLNMASDIQESLGCA